MKKVATFLVGVCALSFVSCATTAVAPPAARQCSVEVNAYARPVGPVAGRTFVIEAGTDAVNAADLEFQEFAAYVRGVLARRGMVEASDAGSADVAVLLTYGIGDPNVQTWTRTAPVYGLRGGGTSSVSATSVSNSGDLVTTTGTVTTPPTYGQTGTETVIERDVTYHRFATLLAVDLKTTDERSAALWKVVTTSTGWSNDLRLVFPIMLAAAEAHVGTSTGQQLVVTLAENDPRVALVRAK